MSTPCICHFLIGVPGSGKSTFAAMLAKLGNYRIVSTDAIRQELYGDAAIQGEWSQIEEIAIAQIRDTIAPKNTPQCAMGKAPPSAIAQSYAIIYDATNAKRAWRMELMIKLNALAVAGEVQWMAWYLQTPMETCKILNQERTRTVPDNVIEEMSQSLQDFPPIPAEGFAAVKEIDVTSPNFDIEQIQTQIKHLPRTLINRTNRTLHRQITLHSYSKLLDFERLMHLISLIIRFPGIGNLQATDSSLVESIFSTVPQFASALDEVSAIMGKLYGKIYTEKSAIAEGGALPIAPCAAALGSIASDLDWLEKNGLIGVGGLHSSRVGESTEEANQILTASPFVTHAYSDLDTFTRLVQTIRFILHHPFLQDSGKGSLKTLVSGLREKGIIVGDALDTVRKDIERVLKPYKILPEFPLRDGYFAGTAILSQQELIKVFGVLQSQAKSLDDPVALDIYEIFADRITRSKQGVKSVYPVRGIGNRCMIDSEFLPQDALSNNLPQLESAIANGEILELNRFPGGGKFALDQEGFFLAYPLQIVFCNLAWYLGYECEEGKYTGLLRFERLDRLFIGKPQAKLRSRLEQEKSLQKLQKLYTVSAGIFLGYSASEQRLFLSNTNSM